MKKVVELSEESEGAEGVEGREGAKGSERSAGREMKMNRVELEKVTLNIGVGGSGEPLENASKLLQQITGQKPLTTRSRDRNPGFGIKKGQEIGVKVTLRGRKAAEFLKKALDAVDNKILFKSFDNQGNLSFGVREYIDFPGMKYDPKIGMIGFDVCVTLCKPGVRVSKRRIASRRVPSKQRVSRDEAIAFLSSPEYGAEPVEEKKLF